MRALVILFMLAVGGLLSVRTADAGGCYRTRTIYGCSTTAPVHYSHQIVREVPYVVKHHDYGHVQYITKLIEVPVSPDYYYSVGSFYRDQLLADAIAYRLLAGQKGGVGPAPVQQMPKVDQQPGNPSRPGPVGGGIQTEVDAALKAVVDAKCVKCHGGQPNRVDLRNLATVPRGMRFEAHSLTNSGAMPRGDKELSNDEVILFYKWSMDSVKASK